MAIYDFDPEATFWWIDNGWLLAVAATMVLAASLTLRYRGPRLRWLALWRAASRDEAPVGRRVFERMVGWGMRFLENPALVVGTVIVTILLLSALSPGLLTPHRMDDRGFPLQIIGGVATVAPFRPSEVYPLGSDIIAQDLLTRLIFGVRTTLSLAVGIVLVRIALGGGLGVLAGWRQGTLGRQILSFSAVSSAIPALIFAYLFIAAIGTQRGFGVFLLGLGLTGWAEWANLLDGAVRWVRTQPYMESARAIGTPPLQTVQRYVLPNLAPQLLPAVTIEAGAVLLLLAELGFLGLFFGALAPEIVPQTMQVPKTTEWGAMLAGPRMAVFRWPWLVLGPAGAFMFAILGFHLFGTGLRGWLDPRRQR